MNHRESILKFLRRKERLFRRNGFPSSADAIAICIDGVAHEDDLFGGKRPLRPMLRLVTETEGT